MQVYLKVISKPYRNLLLSSIIKLTRLQILFKERIGLFMLVSYKKKIKKRKDTTNRKIENKETDYTLLYIKRKRETT